MRWAIVLLCAAALASSAAAAERKRPSIVILLADDWGFSDVGSFGSEIRTPNIDALARAGVRFSDFHVAGSCSPTRRDILAATAKNGARDRARQDMYQGRVAKLRRIGGRQLIAR